MPKKNSYIVERVERVRKGYLLLSAESLEQAKEMLIDSDYSTANFYDDEDSPDGMFRNDFIRFPNFALDELKLAENLPELLTVQEQAQAIWDEAQAFRRKMEVRND